MAETEESFAQSSEFVYLQGKSKRKHADVTGSSDLLAQHGLLDSYKLAVNSTKEIDASFAPYVSHLPGGYAPIQYGVRDNFSLHELIANPRLAGPGAELLPLEKDVFDTAFSLEPGAISGFDPTPLGFGDSQTSDLMPVKQEPLRIHIRQAGENTARIAIPDLRPSDGSESDKHHKKKKKDKKEKHKHKDKDHGSGDAEEHHKKKKKQKREHEHIVIDHAQT